MPAPATRQLNKAKQGGAGQQSARTGRAYDEPGAFRLQLEFVMAKFGVAKAQGTRRDGYTSGLPGDKWEGEGMRLEAEACRPEINEEESQAVAGCCVMLERRHSERGGVS